MAANSRWDLIRGLKVNVIQQVLHVPVRQNHNRETLLQKVKKKSPYVTCNLSVSEILLT